MNNEIPSTELPATPPVQTPPQAPPVQAPPPAAHLVEHGEVTNERELALQRRVRELETEVSERERMVQELRTIPATPPTPAPAKVKRKRGWTDPVFSTDDETNGEGAQ